MRRPPARESGETTSETTKRASERKSTTEPGFCERIWKPAASRTARHFPPFFATTEERTNTRSPDCRRNREAARLDGRPVIGELSDGGCFDRRGAGSMMMGATFSSTLAVLGPATGEPRVALDRAIGRGSICRYPSRGGAFLATVRVAANGRRSAAGRLGRDVSDRELIRLRGPSAAMRRRRDDDRFDRAGRPHVCRPGDRTRAQTCERP